MILAHCGGGGISLSRKLIPHKFTITEDPSNRPSGQMNPLVENPVVKKPLVNGALVKETLVNLFF